MLAPPAPLAPSGTDDPVWRRLLRSPARVALAPLALLLAAVETALRRPSFLIVGALLLMIPPSDVEDVSTSGHVTPADLAAGLVILAMAIRLLTGDRTSTRRGWLPFAGAVVAFAAASITADDVATSLLGFVRYAELFVLIPVAVAMALRDGRDILLVGGALVAVTAFEGAVGLVQFVTKTGASYGGAYIRAVGTFGADQVEALGALLGYGIVATLALGLALRGRARIALLATTVVLLVPLWLTLSRGAWVATAGAVIILLVIHNWRAALAVVGVGVLALTVISLRSSSSGSAVNDRLTSIVSSTNDPDRSVQDRYALWSAAIGMWEDHPIVGVGMKDFATYRDNYAPMSLSAGSDVATQAAGFHREPLLSPHNQYLMVLAEQGTVGGLAFGALLLTLAAGSVRRRRRAGKSTVDTRYLDLAAPGLMVWTLIDFMYGDVGAGPISVLLGILLGLIARRSVIIPAPRAATSLKSRLSGRQEAATSMKLRHPGVDGPTEPNERGSWVERATWVEHGGWVPRWRRVARWFGIGREG